MNYYESIEHLALSYHKGQYYGGKHYDYHLRQVVFMANRITCDDIPIYNDKTIENAAWLHDILEDTNINHSILERMVNDEVIDIVNLVTDPKGKIREERKKLLYDNFCSYPNGRIKLAAAIVKSADRYANQFNSILDGNKSKMRMYYDEHYKFMEVFVLPFRFHIGMNRISLELERQHNQSHSLLF